MELTTFFNQYRKQLINLPVIILALVMANNIRKAQVRTVESLKLQKNEVIKQNEILAEIKQSQEKLNFYKNVLKQKDRTILMNTIGNIAKESEVRILSIKPLKERDYPAYVQYPFTLSISANNYHLIGKFISRLESSADIYWVDSLDMSPAQESETSLIKGINAGLTLSTIFCK